eukprot:373038-Hanusia_phi.AAC.1
MAVVWDGRAAFADLGLTPANHESFPKDWQIRGSKCCPATMIPTPGHCHSAALAAVPRRDPAGRPGEA